jgi:AcrR family transcriptional regulator
MTGTGTSQLADKRSRRRGATLEQAIYQATLEELGTTGYAGLTMDGVARRAQTGKAVLYRRWASKKDLVLDAVLQVLPDPREVALSESVRDNLVAALTIMTDTLAGRAVYPSLDVMVQVLREPELRKAFNARVIQPRLRLIQAILRDGAARGEVDPASVTPLIARTGPALVLQALLLTGKPPTRSELARIVDTVLMPLLRQTELISLPQNP